MVAARLRSPWLGIAIAAAAAAVLPAETRAQAAQGGPFPPLAGAGLVGGALPETAGRVVLVDFWASWCAPCKASFPAYSRIQEAYRARGLVVVAVGVDEDAAAFASFVARMKPSFATVLDAGHRLVAAVQVPTMPTSYLLDRGGRVRFVHPGFHGERTERELCRQIEELLGDRPAPP
jgi:thiol-disulfide isomerase/thioredoxin